tara:strand:- start:5367 stop:6140 length:774 start_codon:yes stop_codon:yes gene_type:complete
MAFAFDDLQVGGQLLVGSGVCRAIKVGDEKINGSAALEGPVVVGDISKWGNASATLMVGALTNDDPDCEEPKQSLGVSGDIPTAVHAKGGIYLDGDLYVTGSVDCLSTGRLESRHAIADASPKKFDMVHPSKGEGYRLAHACIEGAEVGVYHRGRVRNEKIIMLPSYWKDLVHVDSISVQLQPIGSHQDIIVKRWDDEKIYLQSKGGMPIDCFYHIYGERKDVNSLIVEYQGDTWEDHPDPKGDNPDHSGGQNTWTR